MADFGRETRVRFLGGELIFRVDGLQEARKILDGLGKRSTNLSNPFQRFQKHWFAAIDQNFSDEGNPVSWPALSPAYANWKDQVSAGQPMMRLSDRLYDSLTSGTSDTIWQVGPRSIQFGTRVPYFAYHQEGRGRNPVRQTLVFPPDLQSKLVQMVEKYVITGKAE